MTVVGDSRMLLVDGTELRRIPLQVDDRFTVGAAMVEGELHNLRTAGGKLGYAVHLVAQVTGPPDESSHLPPAELAVIGVGDDPSYDVVGTFDASVPPVGVATDLMTLQRPTVERPEPDWPWSEARTSIAIGLGVAAAIALAMGLRWA